MSPTVVTCKEEVKKFEVSTENLLRSIKVLYSGGLLSKEKCKVIRINLTMSSCKDRKQRAGLKFMSGVGLPKLLPYDKPVNYVKTIDFNENIKDMAPEFCSDMDDSGVVNGAYRELNAFLLELAKMYIEVDKALGPESFLIILEWTNTISDLPLGQMVPLLARMMRQLPGWFHV